MADAKKVTILNKREGKLVLPPDPEELKAFNALPEGKRKPSDAPKHRELLAGQALEVSEEEAAKLLAYPGLVDASKIVKGGDSAEVKRLKDQIAAKDAEIAGLKAKGGAADEVELGDGDAVITPAGDKGVIVKMKKKGMCDVKLENGNTSPFKLSDLKADPEAVPA